MELYVFDTELNRIGIIDDFINLQISRNYNKISELTLNVEGSKANIELLQKGFILVKSDDLQRGYLILHREYIDENSSELEIIAPSLNILLNRRIVLGQQEFTGNIENVMKSFVEVNAVSPANTNRIIPNLTIATNNGINITTTEGTSNSQLDEFLFEVANKHDISWDVLINVTTKKLVFTTWKGVDRSTEQTVNPHVIFSKDFDNILSQNYIESDMDYKSTAIVAGEGEGLERAYITVNDGISGYERHETFVDARDLQSTYRNENDEETTLTTAEYQTLLIERGRNKLGEFNKITTFESEVDMYSQFRYGVDYFLGDKVSIKNDDLNIIMHTRIISVTETHDRQRATIEINFGDNIPTLLDKIKRTVK